MENIPFVSIITPSDGFLTITSNSPLITGGVDDVVVNCSAAVDCHAADIFGDLVYTWYNSEAKLLNLATELSYLILTTCPLLYSLLSVLMILMSPVVWLG